MDHHFLQVKNFSYKKSVNYNLLLMINEINSTMLIPQSIYTFTFIQLSMRVYKERNVLYKLLLNPQLTLRKV
jgi:hypothetical protein